MLRTACNNVYSWDWLTQLGPIILYFILSKRCVLSDNSENFSVGYDSWLRKLNNECLNIPFAVKSSKVFLFSIYKIKTAIIFFFLLLNKMSTMIIHRFFFLLLILSLYVWISVDSHIKIFNSSLDYWMVNYEAWELSLCFIWTSFYICFPVMILDFSWKPPWDQTRTQWLFFRLLSVHCIC